MQPTFAVEAHFIPNVLIPFWTFSVFLNSLRAASSLAVHYYNLFNGFSVVSELSVLAFHCCKYCFMVQWFKTVFQCRGCRFSPWPKTKISHASWPEKEPEQEAMYITDLIRDLKMVHIQKRNLKKNAFL